MFWNTLITLCNGNNISPSRLCEILGFSNATATKWKNGSKPRDTAIIKICDYFCLPHNYFDSSNQPLAHTISYNDSGQNIIELPPNITDDDLNLIKFILDKYKNN